MKSTKVISSDLQIPGFPEVVHLKQFDANTRYITIPITDGGSSFTLPDNPVFMVGARLPDGSKVLYDKIINASAPIGVLVSVDPVKWTASGITGATFTKTASGWSKDGSAIDLDDFGVSITKGTPTTGANIIVSSQNAVNILNSGIEIGLAPSLSMVAGTGKIELYIGTNDELISVYCKELQIHEAAVDPYSAFTPQSVCTIIAQIQAFVHAELTAHPEWTTTVQDGSIGREKLTPDVVKELDNKANNDGSYDDMTVGNAKQVLGTVGVEDQTPYGFRTAGGSVDIGDRENVKAIVGGTVVWNQLIDKSKAANTGTYGGISVTKNGDGSITFNGTATSNTAYVVYSSFPHTEGHKYHFCGYKKVGANIGFMGYGGVKVDAGNGGILPAPSGTMHIRIDMRNGDTFDNVTMWPIVIDLTQMFGSTIADYIYSLEQTTAGAGVAWFKKLFPKDYYAYNAGELMSVKASAHNMVGFNAYDPETGKAKVVGGNQYQIIGSYTALSLDGVVIMPDVHGLFTPSANGELIVTGGNATDTCIHLVWSGYRNDEYEEYDLHSYPLDSNLELRGIPKLDANNNLYYDGDIYESDGTVTRRYGVVDLGTLSWSKQTATNYMNFASNGISSLVKHPTTSEAGALICLCSKYINGTTKATDDGYIYIQAQGQIRVKDTANAALTSAEFKTLMSGVYLVYELATPTTETAEPYQETQVVNDFGTEEFVDYAVEQGLRDVAIPVGSITKYLPNLRDKLQNAPNSPSSNGLWVVQRINGANVYIPLATALQMINNGEDPTEEVEA